MTIFYVLSARPPAPRPRRAPAAARPAATQRPEREEWCVPEPCPEHEEWCVPEHGAFQNMRNGAFNCWRIARLYFTVSEK